MSSIVISGDTSGTVTIAAPAVSGTTTLTLPVQTGTVMVNGPAFSAYQSAAQTLSSATVTKIQLQIEEFDTNSNFDNATNYRFTPTVAGYYQVNMALSVSTTSNTGYLILYKNGSVYKYGLINTANALGFNTVSSFLVFLNGSTDYIEMYGYLSTGASTNFGSTATIFSASMVRGA